MLQNPLTLPLCASRLPLKLVHLSPSSVSSFFYLAFCSFGLYPNFYPVKTLLIATSCLRTVHDFARQMLWSNGFSALKKDWEFRVRCVRAENRWTIGCFGCRKPFTAFLGAASCDGPEGSKGRERQVVNLLTKSATALLLFIPTFSDFPLFSSDPRS